MTAPQTLIERTTVPKVQKFCETIITGKTGLHAYERHEIAVPTVNRDVAAAMWVIRCLSNPSNPDSLEVLQLIAEARKQLSPNDTYYIEMTKELP